MPLNSINILLALLTIGGQVVFVAGIIALFLDKGLWIKRVSPWALRGAFIVYMGAMLTSLFYSEIIGFAPCTLCWWQRIFLYPQVILLGLALWKRDRNIADYSIALALPGIVFALYHNYIDWGGSPLIPCAAQVVSCTKRYVFEFGYITIPMMALTAFLLGVLLMIYEKKRVS